MARAILLAAIVLTTACAESRPPTPGKSVSVETACLTPQPRGNISNRCVTGTEPTRDAGSMMANDAGSGSGGSVATSVQLDAGTACAPTSCPLEQAWNGESCRCEGHCDPLAELAARLGSAAPTDCGTLPVNAPAADVAAARSCALDALAAKRAFKLIEWTQDDENWRTANLYAYAGADGFVSLFGYRQMKPLAIATSPTRGLVDLYEARCRGLIQTGEQCDDGQVCLACKELIEESVACRAPASTVPGCLSPGIYNRGKGMNPGECCAPLREISLLYPYTTDAQDKPTCRAPVGYAIFACVQGACGDGRCEEAEDVDCGCSLDCPGIVSTVGPDADAGI